MTPPMKNRFIDIENNIKKFIDDYNRNYYSSTACAPRTRRNISIPRINSESLSTKRQQQPESLFFNMAAPNLLQIKANDAVATIGLSFNEETAIEISNTALTTMIRSCKEPSYEFANQLSPISERRSLSLSSINSNYVSTVKVTGAGGDLDTDAGSSSPRVITGSSNLNTPVDDVTTTEELSSGSAELRKAKSESDLFDFLHNKYYQYCFDESNMEHYKRTYGDVLYEDDEQEETCYDDDDDDGSSTGSHDDDDGVVDYKALVDYHRQMYNISINPQLIDNQSGHFDENSSPTPSGQYHLVDYNKRLYVNLNKPPVLVASQEKGRGDLDEAKFSLKRLVHSSISTIEGFISSLSSEAASTLKTTSAASGDSTDAAALGRVPSTSTIRSGANLVSRNSSNSNNNSRDLIAQQPQHLVESIASCFDLSDYVNIIIDNDEPAKPRPRTLPASQTDRASVNKKRKSWFFFL